jgi:uncharacterized protein
VKRLELTSELSDLAVRTAGDGPEHYTIRGHAAVFNRLSENLGGFRERIAPGAFSAVLERMPDVRLLVDHEASSVMARTANQTLELREDPMGLHVWARVPTALGDAADLRVRMETGLVNQMSFAFTIADEHRLDDDESVEDGVPIYEVREVGELFDVSAVTYPAYPQTDVSLVRMRMLDEAHEFTRALTDQPERRDDGTAAEEQAASAQQDRERGQRLKALQARARLLVVTYPLRDAA